MGLDDRRSPTSESGLLGDRYRLGTLLGRGGAGRVYEAVDLVLGRPVAVKVFDAGGNPTGRFRFATEARLLAGLSHAGLVTVYDVNLDGDQPFLVMRLVDGPTLRDLLDRGPFEPAAVARIGARLADVLAYLHAHDVVHRDIKPANVLVDESGACHLTDFGVARALSAAHLTVSGEFVGTAAYLAPEQVTDTDPGPPADIYALGLLLLECLTGRTEYNGSTVETALARLARPPRIPRDLPAAWHTLLKSMTDSDPAARPDAARCARTLAAIAHGDTAVLPIPAPRHSTAERSLPPRPRAVHAGLAALALAAACAVAATTTTTTPGTPTGEPMPPTPETETVTETAPPPSSGRPAPPAADRQSSPPVVDVDRDKRGNRGQDKGNGKHKGKG